MLIPLGGEFSPPAVILGGQAAANKERFDHLRHRPCRQTKTGSEYVQATRRFAEYGEIALLVRPEPDLVNLFEFTGALQMLVRQEKLSVRPRNAATRLQQPQGQPRRSSGSRGDLVQEASLLSQKRDNACPAFVSTASV